MGTFLFPPTLIPRNSAAYLSGSPDFSGLFGRPVVPVMFVTLVTGCDNERRSGHRTDRAAGQETGRESVHADSNSSR